MQTALIEAVSTGRTDVINTLVESHADEVDLNLVDSATGNTPLHVACAQGHTDCVRFLLRQGCRSDVRNLEGLLPYEVATQEVRRAFFQELLQHVATGNVGGVELLIHCGVDLNQGDGTVNEAALLHWAASFAQPHAMLKLLVRHGADPNLQNKHGSTPLHEAVVNRSVDSAVSLVKLGAKLDVRNEEGQTPLELCDELGLEEMKEVLRDVKVGAEEEEEEEGEVAAQRGSGEVKREEDELAKWQRMCEEKDMVMATLRETIETLLQEKGILKYVKRLQEQLEQLEKSLKASENKVEHLTKLYNQRDDDLETALRDNAMLRSAIHDKEERLLKMLESSHTPSKDKEKTDAHENGGLALASPQVRENGHDPKSIEQAALVFERDRLARELENERRQRYEEARIHLAYANELRKELELTRQQLDSRTIVLQEGISDRRQRSKRAERRQTLFEMIYYTIFPSEEIEEDDGEGGIGMEVVPPEVFDDKNGKSSPTASQEGKDPSTKDVIVQDVNLELNVV